MILKFSSLTLAAICSLFLGACAGKSPLEKRVAAEVAQEQPIPPGPAMDAAREEILFEAETLSPRQRQRLRELHAKTSKEASELRNEISKHQLVLLRSLVDPQKKDAEVDVLKNRIVDLERKRTSHFLGTLDKARGILGRRTADDERFYRAFILEPMEPSALK